MNYTKAGKGWNFNAVPSLAVVLHCITFQDNFWNLFFFCMNTKKNKKMLLVYFNKDSSPCAVPCPCPMFVCGA